MGRIYSRSKNFQEVYSEDMGGSDNDERIIYLSSEVTEQSSSMIIQNLFSLYRKNKKEPISLVISSYGGEIDAMFAIYDAIKFVKCPIHTVGLGKIMSAAVLLLASGEKGKRKIGANARVMIHPIWGGFMGNIFEQENEFKETKRQQELMEKRLAEECNIKLEYVQNLMKTGKDYYLTPEETLSYKIADEIIGK